MSVSNKQLVANRANAQKSTGPKTDEGKAVASQNAVKHGLYAKDIIIKSPHYKEDEVEYQLLYQSLYEELRPETTFQEYLVRKIANCLWRSRSAIIAETAYISRRLDGVERAFRSETLFDSRFKDNDDNDEEKNDEIENETVNTENEPDLKTQIMSDLIRIRTLPDDSDSFKILRYEMRLDRQVFRTYRLLKQLQINHKNEKEENIKREP